MTFDLNRRWFLGSALALGAATRLPAKAPETAPQVLDVPLASGRICRVWRYAAQGRRRGTILFGHGAASAPWKYELLLHYCTMAGYTVLAPLHVDSTDHPDSASFAGMASWAGRIEDLRGVAALIPDKRYVAAGHSYGGMAALALGGAQPLMPAGVTGPLADPRAALVLAFSPPGAMPPLIDGAGYAGLRVPALIQTGTADIPPGATGWEGHLLGFEAPPPGGERYGLVLDGVDHYFGGAICRPELPGPKQLKELERAAQVSRLMLDAWLHRSRAARRALLAQIGTRPGEQLLRR